MAESSESESSTNDLSYHSSPMETDEVEEEVIPKISPAALLKKFEPQYPGRLFSEIWKSKDLTKLVHEVISEYKINKKVVYKMIQLFIDLAGYQYINLESYLKNNELNDIVAYMESSKNSLLLTTGKYFVKISKYSAKCQLVGDFLETFIMISTKEKFLYDTSFKIILNMVEQMSSSNKRPLKHTGVFIALKMQSGLIRISLMIGQKIEMYGETIKTEENARDIRILEHKLEKFKLNNNIVKNLIAFTHSKIYVKNWNHFDSQLHFMRIDCICEAGNWIKIFPERFLKNDCLDFIINSITDNNSTVRLTAINLLYDILKEYHSKILDKKLLKIIIDISKRMNDVSFPVAIRAIETITLVNSFAKLPHTIRDEICKLIYYPHYPIAKAASRFLIQRMNQYLTEPNNNEESLNMLIHFEKKSIQKGIINQYPLVIETIIEDFPALTEIPVYISILENCENDDETISILINILTESVYQTFLGSCSLVRPKQIERKIDPEKVKTMTDELVKSIKILTSLVSPLEKLTPLLVLIRDYGMKKAT